MRREKRNSKIFYSITVLILIICSFAGISYWTKSQLRMAIEAELSRLVRGLINDKKLESNYIKSVKAELIKQTEITLSKINHLRYSEKELSLDEAQKEIIEILKKERFETKYDKEKGYFFGYTYEGKNVFHPTKPWAGQDKNDYRDKYGKFVIQDLIKVALNNKEQGGFDIYMFHTPSSVHDIGDDGVMKLSYVIALEDLQWIIGTGIHLDLDNKFVKEIESMIQEKVTTTLMQVLIPFGIGLIPAIVLFSMHVKSSTSRRISDRLHIRVQQDFGVLARWYDEILKKRKAENAETIIVNLQDLKVKHKNIERALREMDLILENQDPENLGLVYGLQEIKERIEEREQIPAVDFDIPNFSIVSLLCVPKKKKEALFLIAEEALTNASKHAFASHIGMQLTVDSGSYLLIIRDNGIGFDFDEIPLGRRGLNDMPCIIEAVGGSLEIMSSTSGSNKGTTITAQVPRSIIDGIRCCGENMKRNLRETVDALFRERKL